MRQYALPVALAALLALAGLAAVTLLRPAAPLTLAEESRALAAELRCPDCQALSVAESHTAAARAIRDEIDLLLAAGESPDAVRRHFTDSYGEWILLSPTAPIAWWMPVVALLIGVVGLMAWLLRGRRRAAEAGTSDASANVGDELQQDELRQRVRDELERLDA